MSWTIDADHSHLDFAVKHMTIATVRGRFRHFTFDAETNQAGDLVRLTATIDANSIDTNVGARDAHLRSADFFDAEHHPTITFRSTRIVPAADRAWDVEGDLSIRGVTRPVRLAVVLTAAIIDPDGNHRAAAEVTAKINRKDWGLNWNQALELGGMLVGDEVKISAEVEAVRPLAAAAA